MIDKLSPNNIVVLFLSLGILLLAARLLGEAARRVGQPPILGELLAGVMVGPTVLGALSPQTVAFLFPQQGPVSVAMQGFLMVAITLFLLVAGMEVDLSTVWRQGRVAISVSAAGIVVPFIMGFGSAILGPGLLGREPGEGGLIFPLFFGTALAISALPVIAKTLMDLNLYRSDLGMLVIAAAVVDDLTGWLIFAIILGLIGAGHMSVGFTVAATLGFAVFMLTGGRWLIHRVLPWIQAHTAWPGGVLSFALGIAFLGAALTEWIGIHPVFGAFLVGVAFGDSSHLREQTRTILHQFVSFIFAPLFFASVGLKLDFAEHFDFGLTALVLVIACAGKIIGCGLGALFTGVARREAWAVGFAMNARGAMEIILGLLALQYGVIRERMFVALVVMALVTSMMSGPAMRRLLRLRHPRRLDQYLSPKAFIPELGATTRVDAIAALSKATAAAAGLDEVTVREAVLLRESQGATGIGESVAIPHARLEGLKQPVVAAALAPHGVDFDAPDGLPARLIFLLLTPEDDDGAQIEILADIARKFGNAAFRAKALQVAGFTEFLALLRTAPGPA